MRRQLVITAAIIIAAAACEGDPASPSGSSGNPSGPGATSGAGATSGPSGGGGTSSGLGSGGSGADPATGGTTVTTSVGGAGGMGGQGMISVGGGQGACNNCDVYWSGCLAGMCPDKSTLCNASIPLYSPMWSCVCGACFEECQLTCTGAFSDTANCPSCLQTAIAGACAQDWADCQADPT